MKRLSSILMSCMLFSLAATADESGIKTQTQGEVTFVSGGIGNEERDALRAVQAEYNLRLLFSMNGTGEYVSDVKVRINDSNGNIALETVSEGPMLFAKLKPGRYTVTVDKDGHLTHKKAIISGKRSASLSFSWPEQEGD